MKHRLDWSQFGNVVPMTPNGETPKPRSLLWELEAYWAALPRIGLLPRRSDVDPRCIERILPDAVILERVAPGVARFRIASQHLCDIAGGEVRGMPITALFSAAHRQQMTNALVDMFDRPATLHANLKGTGPGLTRPLRGAMVLMPLCLDNGEVTRAMGAIVTDTTAASAPQRMALSDLQIRSIGFDMGGMKHKTRPRVSVDGFAEDQQPLSGRPHLRIVNSAD